MTTGDYLARMKAVGVKELKARLSEYLRYVKAGRSVLVADRGEVIAELRPLRGGRLDPRDAEPLDALAETGEITRAQRPKAGWRWRPKGLGLPAGTAQNLLDAVRGDRRD